MVAICKSVERTLFPGRDDELPSTDLPPSLYKAAQDNSRYVLQLSNGQVLVFGYAVFLDETWIHLGDVTAHPPLPDNAPLRGVQIRASDVVACAEYET